MAEALQPLRIPAGWHIDWNTLFDLDPTEENVRHGYFGGSSLFFAIHAHRRFQIDLEWRPEDDPAGSYQLRVEYAPWLRTERGRRRDKGEFPDFTGSEVVHQFQTLDRSEIVRELEAWLLRCANWVRESG